MKYIITSSLFLLLSVGVFAKDLTYANDKEVTIENVKDKDVEVSKEGYTNSDELGNSLKESETKSEKSQKKKGFFALFGKHKKLENVKEQRDSLFQVVDSLYGVIEEMKTYTLPDNSQNEKNNYGLGSDLSDDYDASVDPDSLINAWYEERLKDESDAEIINLDSTNLTSNIPDSVYMHRIEDMNSFIKLPYNPIIKNFIIYYTEKIPSATERILGLSKIYMPEIEAIFDKYNLPYELKAMAIIESGLNPKAVSRASAKGMWQFIYSTGKHYNLQINSYVDERFDPYKACDAAARYLSDSYKIFHNWPLAIASYNCGVGNVSKAIRRAGGGDKDFWDIYYYLPRETRSYVPSFIAALYTLNYYKDHNLEPLTATLPPHTDTLKINKMLHFEQIAHFTGLTIDQIKQLNPQYLHNIIPGKEREYVLRLPYNDIASFVDNESVLYDYKKSEYFSENNLKKIKYGVSTSSTRIRHRVRSGETLGHLAARYHTSVSSIKSWNHLRGTNIRVGQYLNIYTHSYYHGSSSRSKSFSTKGYVCYKVQRGDNLYDISHKFSGVGYYDLLKINGFTKHSIIYPGQTIRIKKSM